MADFVHLHVRSEYSLLSGACRVKQTVLAAKEMGMRALAITDLGVMYGAVAFYEACVAAGIHPIIGCELAVSDPDGSSEGSTLVLLCKNEIGYRNLSALVTEASLKSDGNSVPWFDLSSHCDGLIALSGGIRSSIGRRLLRGDSRGAENTAEAMKRLFGQDFYLEVCDCGRSEEKRLNAQLFDLGERISVPVAASNDVCFLHKEDAITRQLLVCIGEGKTLDGVPEDERARYLRSAEEMAEVFAAHPEALANTVRIADSCRFAFSFGKTKLPRFDPPNGQSPTAYLEKLASEGLARRVRDGDIVYDAAHDEDTYRMRIRYEQVVITSMGYAPYFLIVADFVGWAKQHRIPTGPGRGSGAGSLIAYLIGITEVDPVKYGLLFESFLNPERVSMPDFDIDFCDRRRDEVIAYVTEKYGADHVCQIITFGTLAAKAAIRDVGRVLGMPLSEVDATARLIPRELKITLREARQTPALKEACESSASVKRLVDLAMSVEGMPRNVSTHAAGVVITDRPLAEYLPLTRSGNVTLTQYDMDTVARLGLLKFDFLALRYLTVIDDTVQLIREKLPAFSLRQIPLDDSETYALIGSGRTDGLFQLESAGMRQLLVAFKPRCLTDIMTAIALYRPGPMDSIDRYLANRNSETGISYPIEGLAEILDETCGCIVYQEQVMEIFRAIAGYSYGKADVVRRAISKKKADVIERERGNFLAGAVERGVKREDAQALFDEMTDFANYGFKKSHAAAYAILSYRTAYLKAHYPAYYYASLLTSVLGNLPKMGEYIGECAKMGIRTLPPDINRSRAQFTVCEDGIRFGLLAIKNVGSQLIRTILREREHGSFTSLYDFLRRVSGGDANKRAVESLIRSGALDGLGSNRAELLAGYEPLIDQFSRGGMQGQIDLFGAEQVGFSLPSLPDFSLREKLKMEKEVCGISCSGHMLDDYRNHVQALSPISAAELQKRIDEESAANGESVLLCGIVTARSDKLTKNGEQMAFVTLEDRTGGAELVIFPKNLTDCQPLLWIDTAVVAFGSLSLRGDSGKILVAQMLPLIPDTRFHPETYRSPFAVGQPPSARRQREEMPNRQTERAALTPSPSPNTLHVDSVAEPHGSIDGVTVYLKVPHMQGSAFEKAVLMCEIFAGSAHVVFYDEAEKKYVRALHLSLDPTDFVLKEMKAVLGENNVVIKKKEKLL